MTKVQFILGRSGTGKTSLCVQAAADALKAGGDRPLVLLSPEQATYQMERAVLTQPDVAGYSRLRVMSFERLGFWLNRKRQTGGELSRRGRQMAAYRVLLEVADDLTLYRSAAKEPGLAQRLSGLLTELQQADCTPPQIAALAQTLAHTDPAAMATRKWQDIARIFAAYTAFFEQAAAPLNPDSQLTQARAEIANASFLQDAVLWVDGFSGFTVQERELLVAMMRQAGEVYIALCLDPATLNLDNTDPNTLDPAGLFYSTEQTYAELLGICRKCKFAMASPLILDRPQRYAAAPGLAHLEKNLFNEQAAPSAADGAVEIACCADARAEAEWAAGRICELVRHKGFRYRQIAVAVPEMDAYAPYLESAFRRFGIPFFLDRPTAVRHHPLAETLQAALAAADGFSTTDVLCTLKSGLAGMEAADIDRLEQYCRMHGIDGREWTDTAAWTFSGDTQQDAAVERLRRRTVEPLAELARATFALREGITAGAFVRAVWGYLERINAATALAAWAKDDPADTRGHRQTWVQLSATLDEMDRVFGERAEKAGVFAAVLADALSSLTIKLIPPTLDQTLVGSIERSRHPEIRAIFLVGTTQKQFPTPLSTADMLGKHERAVAQTQGLELADTLSQQLSMRQYLAYIALTRASELLAVSFPQQDEKGAAVTPSVWVERLEALFTDVRRCAAGRGQTIWQSRSTTELAERLAATCGRDRPQDADTDAAAYVLNTALASTSPTIRAAAELARRALRYDNAATLDTNTAIRLAAISNFSASRLGTFAACPYKHFAGYVLDLQKRPVLRLEPVNVGSFYHKVVETLFGRLRQRGLSWGKATEEELATLCEGAIADTVRQDATITAFMRRQLHPRFVIEAACETVRRFAGALAELERAGLFVQAASEFEFAFEPTAGLGLRGRIDRLDTADLDGQKAAIVFDFKRTGRPVKWADLYYGLDVQLVMYLLAIPSLPASLQAETIAGAFYLPIELGGKTIAPDELDSEQQKFGYKAKGIFNGEIAAGLDKAPEKSRSRYYNFVLDKDGRPYSYYGTSAALRPEDFTAILEHGRNIIAQLADGIHSGHITAVPYRLGTTSPCSYCDYKGVCRFDWQINDYRPLAGIDKEKAIQKMKEKNS